MLEEYNDMFILTPEDGGVEKEETKEFVTRYENDKNDILKFKSAAELDGYTASIIEAAAELANSNPCNTYADFEELIDTAIRNAESESVNAERRVERIRKSVSFEIEKLKKIDNIAEYANNMIYTTYSTQSVTITDLMKFSTDEQLKLDIYVEPVYSIILQINKQWVRDAVNEIMSRWETNEYPTQFVEDYLRSQGVSEEDFDSGKEQLISMLSDVEKRDVAPSVFKQFRAVRHILLQTSNEDVCSDYDILSDTDSMVEYGATLENEIEDGNPSESASAVATKSAVEVMGNKNESMPLSAKVGAFCGKVLEVKYRTAKNFEDVMYETMGEFAPAYKENREAVKKRKAELKEKKSIEHLERERIKAQVEAQKYVHREYVVEDKRSVAREYRKQPEKFVSRENFIQDVRNNKMPIVLKVFIINLFLALISLLILHTFEATIAIIGLVMSLFGLLAASSTLQKYGMVFGGYALFLLAYAINVK